MSRHSLLAAVLAMGAMSIAASEPLIIVGGGRRPTADPAPRPDPSLNNDVIGIEPAPRAAQPDRVLTPADYERLRLAARKRELKAPRITKGMKPWTTT